MTSKQTAVAFETIVTREQLVALRREAAQVGDTEQFHLCEVAIAYVSHGCEETGTADALSACVAAINAAEAQSEPIHCSECNESGLEDCTCDAWYQP